MNKSIYIHRLVFYIFCDVAGHISCEFLYFCPGVKNSQNAKLVFSKLEERHDLYLHFKYTP